VRPDVNASCQHLAFRAHDLVDALAAEAGHLGYHRDRDAFRMSFENRGVQLLATSH